ncbi:MAG: 1-acyl-sn-glycerol-3-phosphate acyltransferase [Bacteroidales bacterium]|nr:1-acyl-sn-glycerol-3-phosphate acyltransferase [Bacteroidales bacterium]
MTQGMIGDRPYSVEDRIFIPKDISQYPSDNPLERLVKVDNPYDIEGGFAFDSSYPYIDKSLKFKFNWFVGFFVLWFGATMVNLFKYGLKIEGKKNLRPYRRQLRKGALAISNHVYRMDAVCVNMALQPFRRFVIPMYSRHFNGNDVWFLRYVGGIPVAETRDGMRKFDEAMDYYHEKGRWALIFPEAVRWDFYPLLRPFRKGSFTLAHKWDCPVVPCFITCRERKGFFSLFGKKDDPLLTVHVCEPVLPDLSLDRKKDSERMISLCRERMEKAGGIILNAWSQDQTQ